MSKKTQHTINEADGLDTPSIERIDELIDRYEARKEERRLAAEKKLKEKRELEKPIPKKTKKAPEEKKVEVKTDILKTLSPLDRVFFKPELKDELVIRVSIPDLIAGREPSYSGVIVHGPAGTGKTEFLNAVCDVFKTHGSYSRKVSLSELGTQYVQLFAKNVEDELFKALEEAKQRKKPSFLAFDESSTLVEKADFGSTNVSKHYQEAIDVLKRYIGNERDLIIALSTNEEPSIFDEALVREGRLTTFYIGYPTIDERAAMWGHFTKKYGILSLNEEDAVKLAKATPKEQGAFIEEFCRTYEGKRRQELVKALGHKSFLDALKAGIQIHSDEIKKSITFDAVYQDLSSALVAKTTRANSQEGTKALGFKADYNVQ